MDNNKTGRAVVCLPTKEAVEVWAKLEVCFKPLFRSIHLGVSKEVFMECYSMSYNFCTLPSVKVSLNKNQQNGQFLYDYFKEFITKYVNSVLIELKYTSKSHEIVSDDSELDPPAVAKKIERKPRANSKTNHSSVPLDLNNISLSEDTKTNETFLELYQRRWEDFLKSCKTADNILSYLNRFWVKRERDDGRNVMPIFNLCMSTWRKELINKIHGVFAAKLMAQIRKDRKGEVISTRLVSTCVQSLITLGESDSFLKGTSGIGINVNYEVYKEFFEGKLMDETRTFYADETKEVIESQPIIDYIIHIDKRIGEEERRVTQMFSDTSRRLLLSVCDEVMIVNHIVKFQEIFYSLLSSKKIPELKALYRCLSRINDACVPLYNTYQDFLIASSIETMDTLSSPTTSDAVINGGESGSSNPPTNAASTGPIEVDPKKYIETLLTIHNDNIELINTCFAGSPDFKAALERAFVVLVNNSTQSGSAKNKPMALSTNCAGILAKYSDMTLRKGGSKEESDIEKALCDIMAIYLFLEDKDVFQKVYARYLANRLLGKLSVSEEHEASMVSKLKSVSGTDYTLKLQKMFQDVRVSSDLQEKLENNHDFMERITNCSKSNESSKKKINFSTIVITLNVWPISKPTTTFEYPPVLSNYINHFSLSYKNQHSGRLLTWLHQQSRAEVQTTYLKNIYTISLSTYQLAILLMYNESTTQTFSTIQSTTMLPSSYLQAVLQILVKTKLLTTDGGDATCAPTSNEPAPGHVFALNTNYRNKKLRININMPIKTEKEKETSDTTEEIEKDRSQVIQAALVRIMKMRKTLKHELLINEVITQLQSRFKPVVSNIKKCIEDLIDKEYIERDETEKDNYHYMA